MIVWVLAGVLALATGIRIGWALVNRQSVVSSAMIVALSSLTVLAALNWPPLTLLIDTWLGRPNISVALSQIALVASAAGSCVMITSVAAPRAPRATRLLALAQYTLAAVVAAVTLGMFLASPQQPEMSPREFLARNPGSPGTWLPGLLYVLLASALVAWVGLRLSNPTRRGRALFLFSAGTALIVAVSGYLLIRALRPNPLAGLGTAIALLLCALAVVAAGALSPSLEDWVGARRELRLIEPLRRELDRRHPNVGIGVRPRGPLVFRVAERLSIISDSLYLEALAAEDDRPEASRKPVVVAPAPPAGTGRAAQAERVARWLHASQEAAAFPGRDWLRQPAGCSDREWILEIARQYRRLATSPPSAGRPAGT